MPAAKPAAPKRRNRKRKRRAASSSSSSASSSSESDSEVEQPKTLSLPPPKPKIDHESSSESSSSSSESDSDSDSDVAVASITATKAQPQSQPQRSPSPPPAQIPSFIPPSQKTSTSAEPAELDLEVKFRKFWMAAVADGFSDDLDELRKESNLSKTRLEMLVHSLAAGTEVFSKDEMEVVLG